MASHTFLPWQLLLLHRMILWTFPSLNYVLLLILQYLNNVIVSCVHFYNTLPTALAYRRCLLVVCKKKKKWCCHCWWLPCPYGTQWEAPHCSLCWSPQTTFFFHGRLARSWNRPPWSSWWASSGGNMGGLTSAFWVPCMCSTWAASPCAASTAPSSFVATITQIPEISPFWNRSCYRWLFAEGDERECKHGAMVLETKVIISREDTLHCALTAVGF